MLFVMAGGGTGGHVVPSLAVAKELKRRGHDALFIGTHRGMEATLVPRAGFEIDWIDIGGLQRVGLLQTLKTGSQLPVSVWRSLRILSERKVRGVFSMGGYVAGPVMLAAILRGTPIIAMEPNAIPGLVARRLSRFVQYALLGFSEAQSYFPPGRSELCGLPVRTEFFDITWPPPDPPLTVLITGGSRGSRSLNQAARESWPLWKASGLPVRIILQSGAAQAEELAKEFAETGLDGEVTAFIHNMPAMYAAAQVVVSRSGAGAVNELAAAGRPALLVPFPFAADDHQRHNAEAMVREGAARMVLDAELNGQRLFEEVSSLLGAPETLSKMSAAAKRLARPGAAERAVDLLEKAAAVR